MNVKMKNMKIGNLGRITLLNILKKAEGDILLLKQVRDLMPSVGFTEDEIKESGLNNDGKSISWKKNLIKEFELSTSIYGAVLKEIKEWNKAKNIRQETFDFIQNVLTKEDFDKFLEDIEKKEEVKEVDNK